MYLNEIQQYKTVTIETFDDKDYPQIYHTTVKQVPMSTDPSVHIVCLDANSDTIHNMAMSPRKHTNIIYEGSDNNIHVWQDVKIILKSDAESFYVVSSKEDANIINQRTSNRIEVDLKGYIKVLNTSDIHPATVINLSIGGCALTVKQNQYSVSRISIPVIILICKDETAKFKLKCECKSYTPLENNMARCGFHVLTGSKEYRTYVQNLLNERQRTTIQ